MRFEEYVANQQFALLRFSTVLTGDGDLAEDIVQTVLGRAYQQWARIAATESPHAYVRRMVVNEYISWRRKWHRVIPASDLETLIAQVPDHAEAHTERLALLHLVTRLPTRQRAAVVLRYYENLPYSEIAAILGIRESTVRSNLARALTTLRVQVGTPAPAPTHRPALDAARTETR